MPGSNTSGQANTDDYTLGRGSAYLATLSSNLPTDYRFLGNSPEFNISIETETLEHQASTGGLKVVDKEVTISQKIGLTITLDELNFENLALFFSGEVATYDNPANDTNIVAYDTWIASAVEGRWYDIVNAAGARYYDITAAGDVVLHSNPAGADTLMVLGTDYDLDLKFGRVFLIEGGTNYAPADVIGIDYTVNGTTAPQASCDEVRALTQSTVSGALKFLAENPAASSHITEFQFHKVGLKAEGDFALISDDWTTMQLSGSAERNITADADSPSLTIRTHADAAS